MAESAEHSTVFDTGRQHLGKVYAKALIGAAENAGITEQVLDELSALVDDVFDRVPRLDATLSSPRVQPEAKTKMLDKAFAGKISPTLLNFLKVLANKNRFDCLRAVDRSARALIYELTDRVDVQIKTAEPLNDESIANVRTNLERTLGTNVILHAHVDPELIGGIVVRVGDTVYDASLANRLTRLRHDIYEKTFHAIKESGERFEIAE